MADEKLPAGRRAGNPAASTSKASDIDAFVRHARAFAPASGAGRLILALDATMSRQPTWDMASRLQGEMFDAVGKVGDLAVQLVYFRGYDECRASKFVGDTSALTRLMSAIDCRAGPTQIGKVLSHALKENAKGKVAALVYIGDAMEEEVDLLAGNAGDLGVRGVPVFIFQEGRDPVAERAFREIARLSRGAWFRFDRSAAATLARLLQAVAVFAAGGLKALEARGGREDRLLLGHLKDGGN
ncbi:MAG: VWA domain-containing protein [Rhizobiaceae bacterium]